MVGRKQSFNIIGGGHPLNLEHGRGNVFGGVYASRFRRSQRLVAIPFSRTETSGFWLQKKVPEKILKDITA